MWDRVLSNISKCFVNTILNQLYGSNSLSAANRITPFLNFTIHIVRMSRYPKYMHVLDYIFTCCWFVCCADSVFFLVFQLLSDTKYFPPETEVSLQFCHCKSSSSKISTRFVFSSLWSCDVILLFWSCDVILLFCRWKTAHLLLIFFRKVKL